MNERVKHINKKKHEKIEGDYWAHSEEESDLHMANDSFENRQHIIEGVTGLIQPSH